MNLCSLTFLALCPIAAIVFHLLPGKRPRQAFLCAINLLVLASLLPNWDSWACLAAFVGVTYGILGVVRARPSGYVVLLAIVGVVAAFLVAKKYAFLEWVLPDAYWERPLVLVGLSYMLFKFIHVLVDQWQGQLARFTFVSYANYQLAFFTLLAGPIQRFNDFERFWETMDSGPGDTLTSWRSWNRLLTGLIKMGMIAPLAWAVFERASAHMKSEPGESSALLLDFAGLLYCYPLFLYFNFSGYTDVVIGCAGLFGLELPENFNYPFLARNVLDYWDRWHISLTHWIRDYVFMTSYKAAMERFPRWGVLLGYVLLFFSLFLAGVWHGTTAGFAVFGAIHGLGVATNRAYGDGLRALLGRSGLQRYQKNKLIRCLAVVTTFHFVCFALIFFSSGVRMALLIYREMADAILKEPQSLYLIGPWPAVALAAVIAVIIGVLWTSDVLVNSLERLGQRLSGSGASLCGLVVVKTSALVLLFVALWGMQQAEQAVVYMRF